jgi:hypothetical protein
MYQFLSTAPAITLPTGSAAREPEWVKCVTGRMNIASAIV